MSLPLHIIATEALALDPADRLRLANELIDSVEGPADASWDDSWLQELRARRERGTSDAIPWAKAKADILARLARS